MCGDRKMEDLIETYKILNGNYAEAPNIPNSLFQRSTQPNLRGHTLELKKDKSSTLIRKNFISKCVVYKWYPLEDTTVRAPAINSFKNCLDPNLNDINRTLVHYL